MKFLPFSRPHIGLHVSTRFVSLAQVHRRWGKTRLSHFAKRPLPPGLIRLSPLGPNMTNETELADALKQLLPKSLSPQSVALNLADLCARTAVFDLEALPNNHEECQALIKWRFQEQYNISTTNARTIYRAFSVGNSDSLPSRPIRIIAATVQTEIVESYERTCLQAGMIPISLGLAGLSVFDWCRPAMSHYEKNLESPSTPHHLRNVFFYLSDWGFTFFAFDHESPIFLRVKPLAAVGPLCLPESLSPPDMPLPHAEEAQAGEQLEVSPVTLEDDKDRIHSYLTLVANELTATLQYFFETHYSIDPPQTQTSRTQVFLVGSSQPERILPQLATLATERLPQHGKSSSVTVIPLYANPQDKIGLFMNGVETYNDTVLSPLTAIMAHG